MELDLVFVRRLGKAPFSCTKAFRTEKNTCTSHLSINQLPKLLKTSPSDNCNQFLQVWQHTDKKKGVDFHGMSLSF